MKIIPASSCSCPLCACKVGPNYKRPTLNVPDQYRGAPDLTTQAPAGEQFAEMKWLAVFQDETLQALIKEALANNYDMKIAATRVLQANANLGITRANQFPQVNGSFGITNEHNFQFYRKNPPPSISPPCRSTTSSTSGDNTAAPPKRHAPPFWPPSTDRMWCRSR